MGDVIYEADYRAKAVGYLLSQYQTSPRLVAFLEALATGAQYLEEAAFGVWVSTRLTTASGDALDQWGALVGEVRGGLTEDEYRRFIQARILANNSTGTTDDLVRVFELVCGPVVHVRHFDNYPASFQITALRSEAMSDVRAGRVGALMRTIKPAGVAMDLVEAVVGAMASSIIQTPPPLDVGVFARSL